MLIQTRQRTSDDGNSSDSLFNWILRVRIHKIIITVPAINGLAQRCEAGVAERPIPLLVLARFLEMIPQRRIHA